MGEKLSTLSVEDLSAKRQLLWDEGVSIKASVEARGTAPSTEERAALKERLGVISEIDQELAGRKETSELWTALDEAKVQDEDARARTRPPIYGAPEDPEEAQAHAMLVREQAGMTPGELFIRSKGYDGWLKKYPQGGPSEGGRGPTELDRSEGNPITTMGGMLGLMTPTGRMVRSRMTAHQRATLISQSDASAGTLVYPQFLGLLEPGLVRPLTIRQLVTTMTTNTDTIEYVREVSRESNAAIVADATAITGSTGLKPGGGLVLEKITDTIKTIAEWVAITRRIAKDAPQLMEYINQYLMDDVALELEDQIMTGNGSGENFEGILSVVTQSVGPPDSTYNKLDLVRAAKRTVRIGGRTNATALVINPVDSEQLDILKASTAGTYFSGGPYVADTVTPVWGLTRVESEAVPEGTAVVGDFRRAILFDREDTSITLGTVNDDLLRNLMRVLAEGRWGFGVIRASAFCVIDFTA